MEYICIYSPRFDKDLDDSIDPDDSFIVRDSFDLDDSIDFDESFIVRDSFDFDDSIDFDAFDGCTLYTNSMMKGT